MSPAAHPHLIRAVSTFNLLLYHKFCDLSSGNFAQIFPKTALKFCAICILTLSKNDVIMYLQGKERKVIKMNEELLKELINRLEMCWNGVIDTCDCFRCPLYKNYGNEQDICSKLLETKIKND